MSHLTNNRDSNKAKVSVIIPFRGGNKDRELSFPFVLKYWRTNFPDYEIIICDDPDTKDFNRGRALNEGIKIASGDIFIFADADCILPVESIHKGIEELTSGHYSAVIPFFGINYLARHETARALRGEPLAFISPVLYQWKTESTGVCNIVLRRKCIPFDTRFTGWGFEDSAWTISMRTLYGPMKFLDKPATHLYHESACNPKTEKYQKGLALCKRYEAASGDKLAIQRLAAEAIDFAWK